MKAFRSALCIIVSLFVSAMVVAQVDSPKQRPVIPGDFADPSIIRFNNRYYAAGTSSEWAPHYPVYTSDDLVNWKQVSHIFAKRSAWMMSSFWAPELYVINNKVYAYYTARDTSGISCVGVATADAPDKPFTDHGPLIRTGKEAIDGFVFNDNGQLYITWKAYGLDKRPIEILSSKLSADGLRLEGEPVSIKKDDSGKGLEGQSMVKHGDYYYLFYSAGSCCGVPCTYNLRVSRSKSVTGPFEEYEQNPVLKENAEWMCTGHGTPVQRPDGKWFFIYHGYSSEAGNFTGRQGLMAELTWNENGWPAFAAAEPSPVLEKSWRDNFNGKLSEKWSWDYRHSEPVIVAGKGFLNLSGKTVSNNTSGTALCVRTPSADYEIETEVANNNASLKGLVIYGDDNNNAGFGVAGNKLVVWTVKNNKKEIIKTMAIKNAAKVGLKMVVRYGRMVRFFFSSGNNTWNEIALSNSSDGTLDVTYTKQWDRAPRPGLIHDGTPAAPAKFTFFKITNN